MSTPETRGNAYWMLMGVILAVLAQSLYDMGNYALTLLPFIPLPVDKMIVAALVAVFFYYGGIKKLKPSLDS